MNMCNKRLEVVTTEVKDLSITAVKAQGYNDKHRRKKPINYWQAPRSPSWLIESIGPTDTKAEQPSTMLQPVTLAKPSGSGNPLLVTTTLANSITNKEFPG